MRIQTDERRVRLGSTGIILFLFSVLGLAISQVYAAEDQGLKDNEIAARSWRLQTEDPPKVSFTVRVLGDLASFFIAYQPADSEPGDPPKTTQRITVDPNNKPDHYGDHLGRDKTLISEALARDTEYVYWLVGTHRDVANTLYASPKAKFKTEPVKGLKEGLLTGQASQQSPDRTTVTFAGAVGKPKNEGIAYIEYGTNPNRLDRKTHEKGFTKENDILYSDEENLLQPETTYYYRLAVDYVDGGTARGGILSVKLAKLTYKKENPCEGRMLPAPYSMATRLSGDLAIVCSYHNPNPSVLKGSGVEGQLVCPAEFPRNLNTKPLDLTIPKVNIGVSIEQQGVGFWRSSDDVRFMDFVFWAQKGEEGQQEPVRQGSQKYHAVNWTPQPQTLIVWVYCSSNWSEPNTFK